MTTSFKERTKWVDVAKAFAIIAVVTDHMYYTLYTEKSIAYAVYFSVSMFILMMGITTFWSLKKRKDSTGRWLTKKSVGIIGPYLLASVIYVILFYGMFDLEMYIERVIHFDIAGPFYFVPLYLQLVLISPVIYQIFVFSEKKKYSVGIEICGFLVVLLVSFITTNFTNILSIYGGGGKLFGGTYLVLLYVGMWFAKYYEKFQLNKWKAWILFIVCLVGSVLQWQFIIRDEFRLDKKIPFGSGINPPSISLFIYTLLIAITIYALGKILSDSSNSIPKNIFDWVAKLGKHTLYIFLYHWLFVELLSAFFKSPIGMYVDSIWIKRIVYYPCMIVGSLLIEFVMKKGYKCVKKAYAGE